MLYFIILSFVQFVVHIRHDTRLNHIYFIIGILRAELCYVGLQTAAVINANSQMIINIEHVVLYNVHSINDVSLQAASENKETKKLNIFKQNFNFTTRRSDKFKFSQLLDRLVRSVFYGLYGFFLQFFRSNFLRQIRQN